jgi:predicted enzyme related to lactoylglutathione lyase
MVLYRWPARLPAHEVRDYTAAPVADVRSLRPAPSATAAARLAAMTNPVTYFEIPVQDMARAIRFYEAVFGCAFERATIDGNDMAFFPHSDVGAGASGALVKGESYQPSRSGTRIYFSVADIENTLAKAFAQGSAVLFPVTRVETFRSVAEFEDSEGNCIALHCGC